MTTVATIGIAGGTASGKTTLAAALLKAYTPEKAFILPLDNYYLRRDQLSPEERALINYDHPDAFEFDLLVQQVNALRSGQRISMPCYDFTHHTRCNETIEISPRPILIVEGILALALPALTQTFDYKVFVDSEDELRLQRRLDRDVRERGRTSESVITQWHKSVQPMFEQFCKPSKEHADLVVSGNVHVDSQVELIQTRISQR